MPPTIGNSLGFPLLTILLLVPIGGALICMALTSVRLIKAVATGTSLAAFALTIVLLVKFEITGTASSSWVFQFADRHDWVSTLGINYWLAVDGISVFLVALTGLIVLVAMLAADFMVADRVRLFAVFMLFLETAIFGVFMSVNLFLFFVFWEAMLIPTYFLLGMWGEERRIYATMKFLIYTMFGSFLMLVAVFFLGVKAGTFDMVGPNGLIAHPVGGSTGTWLFLAFSLAFAIKLPIFPFHTWAPSAYTESPIPVVLVVAGLLSKAGAFGFLRYCLPLFPAAAHDLAPLISVLAIVGMLYAALLALVQTDIKRLVAYSSISHMNLIALGIFALNPTGIDGSVLQLINHSVIISGLFLAVAYIAARTGTRTLGAMSGLGAKWPLLMWVFFIFVLGALDLPGLSSFTGEFLILAGVFQENAWFSAVAALTVILAAWYMIRFFQNSMNGPEQEIAELPVTEDQSRTAYQFPLARRFLTKDLLPREALLLVPLILLILYIGIQPDPLTSRMNATTNSIASIVHRANLPSALRAAP